MNMGGKMNTILRNQSGVALVLALIMIIVITLIALATSYTSIFEITMSGNKRGLTDAFYAADAGINILTSNPTISFNLVNFIPLPSNTGSINNTPFGNLPIPYNSLPTSSIPISVTGSITYFSNLSGPPRGSGWSATASNYAYYQVQCTGIDSAVNGVIGVAGAQATVQEEVTQIIPLTQQQGGM
jgi:hypothetical protein